MGDLRHWIQWLFQGERIREPCQLLQISLHRLLNYRPVSWPAFCIRSGQGLKTCGTAGAANLWHKGITGIPGNWKFEFRRASSNYSLTKWSRSFKQATAPGFGALCALAYRTDWFHFTMKDRVCNNMNFSLFYVGRMFLQLNSNHRSSYCYVFRCIVMHS